MNSINVRRYYQLIKPGIVYGNLLTAFAAFIFAVHYASNGEINFILLLATLIGLGAAIASGCVINNVLDRDIDAHMERTKDRALVQKEISVRSALLYALVLGVLGFGLLCFYTNLYALLATVFGVVVYVGLYTPAKRITAHSTIIGALAGAVPPVVGYAAVSGAIDTNALLLFLILVCWQMPHFFAISLYRMEEYKNAGLPVMSVSAGIIRTQILMTIYAVLFAGAVIALGVTAMLGNAYLIVMSVASLGWILLTLNAFRTKNTARSARTVFFYSLALLLLFSALIALV